MQLSKCCQEAIGCIYYTKKLARDTRKFFRIWQFSNLWLKSISSNAFPRGTVCFFGDGGGGFLEQGSQGLLMVQTHRL
jgi:hypothetical protein